MTTSEPLPPAPSSLTIAIDFDQTWTADPHAWRLWHDFMVSRGHTVILATARKGWSDDMNRAHLPKSMPIIYCWGHLKERAVTNAGYVVNIWIDDMPGMIQNCLLQSGDIISANVEASHGEQ